MKSYKSESTVLPAEWDLQSSKHCKYQNQNIVTITRDDVTFYQYDVIEYSNNEYIDLILNQNRADIDYMAIMGGIEL